MPCTESTSLLPPTLALIEDDAVFAERLSHFLRAHGIAVDVFGDSSRFLAGVSPYAYEFYLVAMMGYGIGGIDLVKVLRMRSQAGVLVISRPDAPDRFGAAIEAGADMYLANPAQLEHVVLAIRAIHRRAIANIAQSSPWRLDRRARQLLPPDGTVISLTDSGKLILGCFIQANGTAVTREHLCQYLEQAGFAAPTANLNAMIYRLRLCIGKATTLAVPLQSKSRVGYVFEAPLTLL